MEPVLHMRSIHHEELEERERAGGQASTPVHLAAWRIAIGEQQHLRDGHGCRAGTRDHRDIQFQPRVHVRETACIYVCARVSVRVCVCA